MQESMTKQKPVSVGKTRNIYRGIVLGGYSGKTGTGFRRRYQLTARASGGSVKPRLDRISQQFQPCDRSVLWLRPLYAVAKVSVWVLGVRRGPAAVKHGEPTLLGGKGCSWGEGGGYGSRSRSLLTRHKIIQLGFAGRRELRCDAGTFRWQLARRLRPISVT